VLGTLQMFAVYLYETMLTVLRWKQKVTQLKILCCLIQHVKKAYGLRKISQSVRHDKSLCNSIIKENSCSVPVFHILRKKSLRKSEICEQYLSNEICKNFTVKRVATSCGCFNRCTSCLICKRRYEWSGPPFPKIFFLKELNCSCFSN